MANNRMWLVNDRTGARVMLAKYYPSTGWYMKQGAQDAINAAFDSADFGHLSPEERDQNNAKPGFGPPYSVGGAYGESWRLEYETDPQESVIR